jgi:hypothetical protein
MQTSDARPEAAGSDDPTPTLDVPADQLDGEHRRRLPLVQHPTEAALSARLWTAPGERGGRPRRPTARAAPHSVTDGHW